MNRFLVQAVAGVPLTVYGKGGQVRGYLNLRDTLQCVALAAANPPPKGRIAHLQPVHRDVFGQPIGRARATRRQVHGLRLSKSSPSTIRARSSRSITIIRRIAACVEMGLQPHPMTDDVVAAMLERVAGLRERIVVERILPRVRWR